MSYSKNQITAGELLERWGINTAELIQLLTEYNIKYYDLNTFTWIIPRNLEDFPTITAVKLRINASLPIQYQKLHFNFILFNLTDIEEVENEHPELIKEKNDQIPTDKIKLHSGYLRVEALIKTTNEWEIFEFNETQGKIVEDLHKAPNHELHSKTLLKDKLGRVLVEYKIYKYFRNHTTWRKLIVQGKKRGFWKLNI